MNKKHSQGLWKAVSQLQIQSLFHNIYDKVYKQSHRWYKSGELGLFLKEKNIWHCIFNTAVAGTFNIARSDHIPDGNVVS